jgi:mRNA interferase RelE/StbE
MVRFIRTLHPELKRKMKSALKMIVSTPDSGKTLRDELVGLKSFRVGRFRIVYRIRGRTIDLVAIGPREKIYQETYRLIIKKENKSGD